jgi:hypothetical protein
MYIDNPERVLDVIKKVDSVRSLVVSIDDNGKDLRENNRILLASLNTGFLMSPSKICMHFLKCAYFHRIL